MKLILIGFLIGIGKVMPGVSGALLAIRFNVYENAICAIKYFFKDIYNNLFYLSKLGIGIILAVLLFSNIFLFLYQLDPFFMNIVFAILILTGLPDVYKKSDSKLIIMISFILTLSINFFSILSLNTNSSWIVILLGVIESVSIIIPGISGTAILINLGLYEFYLSIFTNINLTLLIPYIISLLCFSLFMINIVNYIIEKYNQKFYSAITGFLCASIILMFI